MAPWIVELVRESAAAHGIEGKIMLGLVQAESGGDPDAMRFEKKYHELERPGYFAENGPQSLNTELAQQAFSWGLAQVMGCTARRLGFGGPFLSLFCRLPRWSVDYGCLHILRDLDTGVTIHVALARYNGGRSGNPRPDNTLRSQEYVDKVLTLSRNYA